MEEPKRLTPNKDTLRQLYVLSGNQCAYPGCRNLMFNHQGNFVGQICHIEAALPKGERFNPNMTNEQRRTYDNLMLMCYDHHIETDKEDLYPVHVMKKIKHDHETNCMNWEQQMINNMYNSFQDVTQMNTFQGVTSLKNLFVTIDGQDYRKPEEIQEDVEIFNGQIQKFIKMSPDAINLFKIAFNRASTDRNKLEFGHGDMLLYFCYNELHRAIGQLEKHTYESILDELIRNEFITYDDDERMFFIIFPKSEANFWFYMKEYSFKVHVNFEYIFNTFDFTCFD